MYIAIKYDPIYGTFIRKYGGQKNTNEIAVVCVLFEEN